MIKATSSVSDVLIIIYIIYWTKCYEPRETKEYGYTTSLSLITFILSIMLFLHNFLSYVEWINRVI